LFQVPGPGVEDPSECLDGPELPECFSGVLDLGAIDIQRARDHGVPLYNVLRRAYGLPPKRSFTQITGEKTQKFPNDPKINRRNPLNDPDILDFIRLFDRDGNRIKPGSEEADEGAVRGVRRTTLAARLKAMYGRVSEVDAFVGMMAERHVPGTEFGELQIGIWTHQFEALRDGDRFYYESDPVLEKIERRFGVTYEHTLAELIMANTDVEDLQANVFVVDEEESRG
jgi:Animal haem peroxidase